MAEVANRLLQTLQLKRDAFVWMEFNDRASGDAFLLVVITRFIISIGLGVRSISAHIEFMLSGAVFWLVVSGVTYAIAKSGFGASLQYAVVMRIVGFAYPTLLLFLVTARLGLRGWVLPLLLAAAWLIFITGRGLEHVAEINRAQGLMAAAGGIVGFIIVNSLLGLGF